MSRDTESAPLAVEPYSEEVRALFAAPLHAGEVQGGAEAYVDDQGVRVRLTLAEAEGRVTTLRFQAWGCPHLLAAAEALCARYEGRPRTELAGARGSEIMQRLAIPVEKTGRILVLEDAARSLG